MKSNKLIPLATLLLATTTMAQANPNVAPGNLLEWLFPEEMQPVEKTCMNFPQCEYGDPPMAPEPKPSEVD